MADPIEAILGPGGRLAKTLDGYEAREEQRSMARAAGRAFEAGKPLLVEAGTGTGKSLAYLVPAALSGLRVVVSTATKALGEQLVERDLPLLRKLGLDVDVALVKGLGNYVCRRRLEDYRRAVESGRVRGDPYLEAVSRWVDRTETGDRAEAFDVPDDAAVWREVTSSSDTRLGQKCHFYESCFVTGMRRRAEKASIVVTNHHLYCADLALRAGWSGAQALPDHDAVVFDEAHAIEDVASDFFGVRVTRTRVEHLVRDVARALDLGTGLEPALTASLRMRLAALSEASATAFQALPRASAPAGRVLLDEALRSGETGASLGRLEDEAADLAALLREAPPEEDAFVSVLRRAGALADALRTIVSPTRDTASTHVAFVEPDARGGGAIGACPVEVGGMLAERLWSRMGAAILTSATLSTGRDGFTFVRQRLGLPEGTEELQLDSPFDYAQRAALYTPRHLPEPRDDGFIAHAADEIERLVSLTGGGAFVLCTSVRHMRAFAAELRQRWTYATWVQGEAPKQTLLQRFRDHGDGVLFATSSFWEGVDVPGRALRLVVLDKLPFEVPSDPVVAARIARLEAEGHSAFRAYQLPTAALALKQGFGRLIRTRRDAGIVALLDKRVVTRPYGRALLDALPPASRCTHFDEIRAFWLSLT